jgi:epoxide hydrolase-like predicted phosphatase
METIRSVIFDWGGVLIEDPGPPMVRYCADAISVSKEEYIKVQREFVAEFRTGHIREETFWKRVCGELDVAVPKTGSLWAAAFRAVYQSKAGMLALARKLSEKGLKVALLSNTEMPAVEFFYKQGYGFFDVVVFSCVEGTKKPEREIYELTLNRLGCRAGQVVLIDDHEKCIEGAKGVGLNTILFEDTSQVRTELTRLGVKLD